MKGLFYSLLISASKNLGTWIFTLSAWFISTGYFLLFPGRVRVGVRFFRALFPQRRPHYHLWCTWRQYHSFADLFLDRILVSDPGTISFNSFGLNRLREAVEKRTGGIILMSHVGSWEIAALLLKKELPQIRLLLYMGTKEREEIEAMQKKGAIEAGIRVIALNRTDASPFDIVEGVRFLRGGDFVSMTGDLVWNENQRSLPVRFLGHEVLLPQTPHLLALMSGAPLFIFFSYRTRKRTYDFSIKGPIHVSAPSRTLRAEAIKRSVREYAAILEQAVREHPYQWYHFEPFLGKKIGEPGAGE
ncbi:MAG: lysophospholipid acyltransferase family protein [Deltaproteobacteria bacterium]|nr:lysophospholipid acyltransferase family protein [Deltaproteobacteria bacterium]